MVVEKWCGSVWIVCWWCGGVCGVCGVAGLLEVLRHERHVLLPHFVYVGMVC